MSAVLENELLEVKERSLVIHSLPDLNHCSPSIVRERCSAALALLVSQNKGYRHGLLEDSAVTDLLLYRDLELKTSTVWLSPDPSRVNKLHFFETGNLMMHKVTGKYFAYSNLDLSYQFPM